MTTKQWEPLPGSLADRAIAVLESDPAAELLASAIAERLGGTHTAGQVSMALQLPLQHGLVFARQKGSGPRSPLSWSKTDHKNAPRFVSRAIEAPPITHYWPRPEQELSKPVEKPEAEQPVEQPPPERPRPVITPDVPPRFRISTSRLGTPRFSVALWDDCTLELRREGEQIALLTRSETLRLARYFGAIEWQDGGEPV